MSNPKSLPVAFTMGDANGIGPEIIIKAVDELDLSVITPIIFGAPNVFEFYNKTMGRGSLNWHIAGGMDDIKPASANIIDIFDGQDLAITPGSLNAKAGTHAMQSVEAALKATKEHNTAAMVTAPISKEAVNKGGYTIPGHTEFLAEHTNTKDFMMMLCHNKLRVGLATIHIPVAQVAPEIQPQSLQKSMQSLHRALKNDFGINQPRIAVLGLNPHAGDGGIIGDEEIDIITPAIEQARDHGIQAEGPFPADGFFGNRQYHYFDGVLAMYHDQGLVPFKTLSFGGGVNVTAGLPIVRTSPDHGTAFDIAGQNKANPGSLLQAVHLARHITENRGVMVS